MKINIDKIEIEFSSEDKNIIDVAGKANINIPGICYRSKTNKGCCQVCIIEINNKIMYACGTKPVDGMNIVFDREDLNKIRKDRIKKYQELPEYSLLNNDCNCDCTETKNNTVVIKID